MVLRENGIYILSDQLLQTKYFRYCLIKSRVQLTDPIEIPELIVLVDLSRSGERKLS